SSPVVFSSRPVLHLGCHCSMRIVQHLAPVDPRVQPHVVGHINLPVQVGSERSASTLRGSHSSREPYVRYEHVGRLHLVPGLGNIILSKLTPQQVKVFYARALREATSPQVVRYCHILLCVRPLKMRSALALYCVLYSAMWPRWWILHGGLGAKWQS